MSTSDGEAALDQLETRAKGATPGPWRYDGIDIDQLTDAGKGYPLDVYPDSCTVVSGKCSVCGNTHVAITRRDDAVFIAAASPDVVRALITRLREAEQMRDQFKRDLEYARHAPLF